MVQILPRPTSISNQIGEALGSGLSQGIQKGADIGVNRAIIQNALRGLENMPAGTTPAQLASKLIQATAGIPGAERYVAQLYDPLRKAIESNTAFGPGGSDQQGAIQQNQQLVNNENPQGQAEGQKIPGATAQDLTSGLPSGQAGGAGGILGTVIPQDEIEKRSVDYARRTSTGIQGAQEHANYLLGLNKIAEDQRAKAEQKALEGGIPQKEIPTFMQLGQRHKNAKTFDDWYKATERDYKEFNNLTHSLEDVDYPGIFTGLYQKLKYSQNQRDPRLKRVDNTVKRLVDLGFEQKVRDTLHEKGLSPTEIEERIHPFSEEQNKNISKLPPPGGPNSKERLVNFFKDNVNSDTSLLALRQKLWEKGYDWQDIARAFNDATSGDGAPKLTTAQTREMSILETEPPRQSLSYIFQDAGNVFDYLKGQK